MGNNIYDYLYDKDNKKKLIEEINKKIEDFYENDSKIINIDEEKNKKYSNYLRMIEYNEQLKKIKKSDSASEELKKQKIKRKVILLKHKYKNVDLEKKEIKFYKEAGCNSREDVIRLEILYIKSNLKKNQSDYDFDTIKTINRLKMLEKSLDEDELNSERYTLIKKYLVVTELANDLDVSLLSVIDELYNEYVDNDKTKEKDEKTRLLK